MYAPRMRAQGGAIAHARGVDDPLSVGGLTAGQPSGGPSLSQSVGLELLQRFLYSPCIYSSLRDRSLSATAMLRRFPRVQPHCSDGDAAGAREWRLRVLRPRPPPRRTGGSE